MTFAVSNCFFFTAHWNEYNKNLKDTLLDKVSKFALYYLHKIAVKQVLPCTTKKIEYIENRKESFDIWLQDQNFTSFPIVITTPDGITIRGTFFKNSMSRLEDPIVIFSQPNSFISKGNTFRILIEEGLKRYSNCNFLIYDYRGCGESQGDPLLAKEFILDGEAVYQFVKDQLQVPPKDIHMLGYSFGGSVSAQVKAMHPECSGNYVTDRSFSSVPEVAAERFTNKIISFTACRLLHFLGWNILNSTEALAKIKSRVLVIFHPEDLTIKGISQLYKKVPQWTNFFYMNLAQRSFRAVSNALVHGVALHSFENEKGEKAHIEALDFLLKKVIY